MRPESVICDLTDIKKLKEIVEDIRPSYIINCVGILIKGSKKDSSNAILLNSYIPHYLAKIADNIQARVIHISTDCVFSGKKGRYVESDFKDANDIYGRSKALGELDCEDHLTIRTSIVGPELKKEGEGLLHWFLGQAGSINGFEKAFWGGVTTLECAKAINQAIKQDLGGLIHLTNGSRISKFELLCLFKKTFAKNNIVINSVEGKAVDKSLVSARTDFDHKVAAYDQMISEMKDAMKAIAPLYSHYAIDL